jgi:protein subunit release factor B
MRKELLFSITKKDMVIQYFSGTGPGGQSRNKNQNCVRLRHIESGVVTTGQSNKERKLNLREAFNNLIKHPKFKIWHSRKVHEILSGQTIGEKVDEMMHSQNLRFEIKEDEKWVEEVIDV